MRYATTKKNEKSARSEFVEPVPDCEQSKVLTTGTGACASLLINPDEGKEKQFDKAIKKAINRQSVRPAYNPLLTIDKLWWTYLR